MGGRRLVSVALAAVLMAGCSFEYPTEWQRPERGTFGTEVFKMIRKELSLSATRPAEKVLAFDQRRTQFVSALDHIFPEEILKPLHIHFVDQLPLYDNDILPGFTRKAGAVLQDLSKDTAALEVLARWDARKGYDPDLVGMLARVAEFEPLRDMTQRLATTLLSNYGRDADGRSTGQPGSFGNVLAAASKFLSEVQSDRSPDRIGTLVADFLLREDDRLAQNRKVWAVRLDPRGVAEVAVDPATNKLYTPYVDANQDGMADLNATGLPVDTSGRAILLKPFGTDGVRDADNRLLARAGSAQTVFRYVDLRRTLLSSLLPDMRAFMEKDVPFRSLRAAQALLGSRAPAERDGEQYQGFSGKPILDVTHGLFAALDSSDVPKLLLGLQQVLDKGADEAAGTLRELDRIDEVRDRHPGGGLVEGHSLEDDLLPIVKEIAETPGLLQAMLEALAAPASRGMRNVFAKLMKYKKARVTESDVDQGRVFQTVVDRNSPDRGTNKSLFQRLMELMWETSGVGYEPEALGIIPLGFIFEITDLAEFYIDSVAGNAEVPTAVTWVTPLSKFPTPQELNRFLNTEQTLMSEPVDRDGYLVREHNGDTLYALEAAGGPAAMRPLAKAFSDRGKTKLLVKLFVTLHLHYASLQSDRQSTSSSQAAYSKRSGIVTVEPFLQELLGETPFLDRQTDLVGVLAGIRVSGEPLGNILARVLRKAVTGDSALRTRDGQNRITRTSGNVVSPVTPWDLLRLGLRNMDAALDADSGAKSAWDQASKDLVDILLGTQESGGTVQFTNQRAVVFTSHLLGFLAERIQKHVTAGVWSDKLKQAWPADLQDLVTGPGLAAAVDLFNVIDNDTELKDLFRAFNVHILPRDGLEGDRLLRIVGRMLDRMKDGTDFAPLARFLSRIVHPSSGLVHSALTYFQSSMAVDPRDLLRGIIKRGAEGEVGAQSRMGDVGDVLGAVLRVEPGSEEAWTAADFGQFFGHLSNFLLDKEKGLEKLIKIVKSRN